MGICLAVTSGKGGTGKSTVSSGLAISFNNMGKSVLLIDLDEALGCLDIFFEIDMKVVFNLSDILTKGEVANAIYSVPNYKNIRLIPAPTSSNTFDSHQLKDFVIAQKQLYDVVILDMSAGVNFSILEELKSEIFPLTVCNSDPVSVRDAAVVQKELMDFKVKPRLIINRFDSVLIKNKTYQNIDDIIDNATIRLIGIVPVSQELALFPIKHKLKKRGNAQKALTRIAARILGANIPLPNPKKI